MTLEEFRIHLLRTLKDCRDPGDARVLLAGAYLLLSDSRICDHTQKAFWKALSNDLDVIAQESMLVLEKQSAADFSTVVTVAQAEIARYRGSTSPDSSPP